MALITSDCGKIRSLGIKWPQPPRNVRLVGAPGAIPFNITNYPSVIKAKVVHLPGWVENNQSAANEPPSSPIDCKTVAGGCGPAPITVLLVPHGATDLRIAGLPWIAPK